MSTASPTQDLNPEESFNLQPGPNSASAQNAVDISPSSSSIQQQQSSSVNEQQQGGDASTGGGGGKIIKKKKKKPSSENNKEEGGSGGTDANEASMMAQSQKEGSPSPGKVKHGRRALREGEYSNVPLARKGWGGGAGGGNTEGSNENAAISSSAMQAADMTTAPANFSGNADAATLQAIEKNQQDALQAHEALVQEVAQAATEFHSSMPKQSDLERATAAKFQSLLQAASQEGVDLQCLMATLTGQFDDDDSTWEPDQLLMQLTSEINDRLGGAGDEEDLDANVQYGYGYHDGTGVVNTAAAAAQMQQQQQQNQNGGGGGGRDRSGGMQQQQQQNSSSAAQQQQEDEGAAVAHGRRRRG